ncbi:hypothetical protein J7444_19990 [Labrenzia sp. R4_1]|uniref:hypothetical protein n=1 Tax=Labrenzia sp. R4_1 TaxID=2821106 RepID=UPI001ADB5C64|nr:hypothetical protein [Labrenzia sp. R4_1]MBO9427027.1 hypothetical protein [Labrenzia sp. R4_1]
MHIFTTVALLAIGIVHLLPLSGVLGVTQLQSLYGLSIDDPNLEILMRHRAVLFGLLGVFLIFASFKPPLQMIALIGGFASTATFCVLAWKVGQYNAAIGKVVYIDVGLSVLALIAIFVQALRMMRT